MQHKTRLFSMKEANVDFSPPRNYYKSARSEDDQIFGLKTPKKRRRQY